MDIIQSGAVAFDQFLYDVAKTDKSPGYQPSVREISNMKVDWFNGLTVALISTIAFGILGVIPISSMIVLGAAFFAGRVIADASFNVVIGDRGLGHVVIAFVNAAAPATQKPTAYYTFNDVVVFYNRFGGR